jgi:DNA primase
MKIPDDKIDEIRGATDIVDLVGGFVKLKKRGKNYLGLCPFHAEKTPSFNVSADRQMYHCFGCGAGGNVFTFLMEIDKVSFVEAVRTLAKNAGIDLPEPGRSPGDGTPTEQERAYALCRLAGQYFHANLTGTPEGKLALEYLKHRGITTEMSTHFGLGYSMNSWDAFIGHAKEHGYTPEFVARYGLARKREDGSYYDYFRGRLIFPVFTATGRVVGFGARKLREDDPLGKYINSPETPLFNKSRILYGLSQSKEAIRDADEALLVEGYMDLISLWQAGFRNIIASSGTALTADQITLVRRYTRTVTLVYDADSAGSRAAIRGIDLVLEQDMDVKVAKLPEGDDPDSFVRKKGAGAMRELLGGAGSFVDFIIASRTESDKKGGDSPEERSKTVRLLIGTVARMPDALKRDFYLKYIAQKFDLRESTLQAELSKALKSAGPASGRRFVPAVPPGEAAPDPVRQPAGRTPLQAIPPDERDLFAAVLRGGEEVARLVGEHLAADDFSHPTTRALAAGIAARLADGESIEAASLIDDATDPAAREFIAEIMMTKYTLSRETRSGGARWEPGEPLRIARDTILAMKKKSLRASKLRNQEMLKEASARGADVLPFQQRNTLLDEELGRLEKEGLGKPPTA